MAQTDNELISGFCFVMDLMGRLYRKHESGLVKDNNYKVEQKIKVKVITPIE